MHEVHRGVHLVNAGERVRYERVQRQLAPHVVLHHAGQRGLALDAAERRAQPLAPGDQLEGAGCDLLPRRGHPDDDAAAPPTVRALQRRAHQGGGADALERVVRASESLDGRHVDHDLRRGLAAVLRVGGVHADNSVAAQLPCDRELGGVHVDLQAVHGPGIRARNRQRRGRRKRGRLCGYRDRARASHCAPAYAPQ